MATVAAEILADDPALYCPCQEVGTTDYYVNLGGAIGYLEDHRELARGPRRLATNALLNDTLRPAAPAGIGRHGYLNGFQSITFPQTGIFAPDGGNGFTIMGWFHILGWASGAKLFSSRYGNTHTRAEVWLKETSLASKKTDPDPLVSLTFPAFPRNVWEHIALTVEVTGEAVVYVDGDVWASGQIAPLDEDDMSLHTFGMDWYETVGVDTAFTQLAAWNRVLSPERIAAIHAAQDVPAGNIALMPERLDGSHIAKGFVTRIDLGLLPATWWVDLNTDFSNLEVLDEHGVSIPFDLVTGDHAAQTGEVYARVPQFDPQRVTWCSVIGGTRTALPVASDPLGSEACWQDYEIMVVTSGGSVANRAPGPVLTPVGTPTVTDGDLVSGGVTATISPALEDFQTGGSVFFPGDTDVTPGFTYPDLFGDGAGVGTKSLKYRVTSAPNLILECGPMVNGTSTRLFFNGSAFAPFDAWYHLIAAWDDIEYVHKGFANGGAGVDMANSGLGGGANSFYARVPPSGPVPARMNRLYMRAPTKPRTRDESDITALSRLEYLSWRRPDRFFAYEAPVIPTFSLAPSPGAVTATLGDTGWDHEVRIAPASDPAATTTYAVPAGTTSWKMKDLEPATAYVVDARAINPLGTSAWSATQGATTPAATYRDDFNRANSNTTPGAPLVGGPYTVRTGTWGIISNQLYTSASTPEAQMTFPGEVDPDFQVKIKAIGSSPGIMWRWVDVNNFWVLVLGTTPGLFRRTGGTYVQFHSSLPAPVVNDVYRVVCRGRYVTVFRNGRAIISVEDPWAAVATATMGYRFNSDIVSRLDDAIVNPALEESLSMDVPAILTPDALRNTGTLLYKGRDTKLADEGAVA